jgi:hypothetical protein
MMFRMPIGGKVPRGRNGGKRSDPAVAAQPTFQRETPVAPAGATTIPVADVPAVEGSPA